MKRVKLVQIFLYTILCVAVIPLLARDTLLEFKGAYFRPTDGKVRKIYGGAALWGPEVTFQLGKDEHWHGFLSMDFLQKNGESIGFCSPTKLTLVPIALGVKYFVPFYCSDFYAGLGLEPVYEKTQDCSRFVRRSIAQWGVGGIIKFGTYIDLFDNCFLDLFIDYSFVRVGCHDLCHKQDRRIVAKKANIGGAIFGAGFGYRFT